MNAKRRVEAVGAALRRQRQATSRTLLRYEGGPCWHNGRQVEPLPSDLVVEIVYNAPADAENVVHMVWDYNEPTE